MIADGIGASDCERLGSSVLAQPANALTSLSYVGVGLVMVVMAIRAHRCVGPTVVFGVCLSAIGVGSVLFHGPQPAGSRVLHDLPILLTVIFVAISDLLVVSPRLPRPRTLFMVSCLLATAMTIASPDAGAVATATGLALVVALEWIVYRRRLRPIDTRSQRLAYLAVVATGSVAGASWLLGRTGSPFCDPQSTFQLHGLWHVISAVLFGLWWWLAYWKSASRPVAWTHHSQ